MKKVCLSFFIVGILFAAFFSNLTPVFSDELDEITKEISELQEALEMSKKATVPLESQLNNLED